MKTWQRLLPLSIPAAFFLKDILATIVVLSNEPGVSPSNVFYYSVALLPGSLFVSNGHATFVNVAIGFLVGLLPYLRWLRRAPIADGSRGPALPGGGEAVLYFLPRTLRREFQCAEGRTSGRRRGISHTREVHLSQSEAVLQGFE